MPSNSAKKLPPVDVVLVGFGWTGAILGQELTDAGLNVLAIERGGWRDTSTDFAVTFAQDELRYYVAARSVRGAGARDAHFPQRPEPDRAADAPSRLVPAGDRRRRRRHPLERTDLALPAERFPRAQPQRAALRQAARRHDGAGLGRHL